MSTQSQAARLQEHERRLGILESAHAETARVASEALLRLDGHEKRCGDRYDRIDSGLGRMQENQARTHQRIDEIYGRIVKWGATIALSIVSALFAIIGYLLIYGPPWLNGG